MYSLKNKWNKMDKKYLNHYSYWGKEGKKYIKEKRHRHMERDKNYEIY